MGGRKKKTGEEEEEGEEGVAVDVPRVHPLHLERRKEFTTGYESEPQR